MKKILLMFNENASMTREAIKGLESIQNRYVDIETKEYIQKNPELLKQFTCVIDCTSDSFFYKNNLSKRNGREVVDGGFTYLLTPSDKYIMTGPSLSQLTASLYSMKQSAILLTEDAVDSLEKQIKFIGMKIPKIRNILLYEEALEKDGIILNNVMEGPKNKIYKLVLEIPKKPEPNVEYIVPDSIRILYEFVNGVKDVLR